MNEDKYQKILDYMAFEGLDYSDDKDFVKFLVEQRCDSYFTGDLVEMLLRIMVSELKDYPEYLEDLEVSITELLSTAIKENK